MRLETAIKKLTVEYEMVKRNETILNPVAYALYQVWKEADKEIIRVPIKREVSE